MKKILIRTCLVIGLYLMLDGVLWFGLKLFYPSMTVAVLGNNSIEAMKEADIYAFVFLLIGYGISWCCFHLEYPGQSLLRYTRDFWMAS